MCMFLGNYRHIICVYIYFFITGTNKHKSQKFLTDTVLSKVNIIGKLFSNFTYVLISKPHAHIQTIVYASFGALQMF